MPLALGIDPGLNGGIALVSTASGLLEVADIPTKAVPYRTAHVQRMVDCEALEELVQRWCRRHWDGMGRDWLPGGALERLGAFGASELNLVSMGQTWGACDSVLQRYCDVVLYPSPRQWKEQYGLDREKRKSVDEVIRRYQVRLRHDQAEAVLLATWRTAMLELGRPEAAGLPF